MLRKQHLSPLVLVNIWNPASITAKYGKENGYIYLQDICMQFKHNAKATLQFSVSV